MPVQNQEPPSETPHRQLEPSAWVCRWMRLLPAGSVVLDLACGYGRHVRLALAQGHEVVALDRDGEALARLSTLPGVRTVQADIEQSGWPFPDQRFDAVIVTNYLYRPLFPLLIRAVAHNGLLIYETFARGNERFGRPRNPDFLLKEGELYEVVRPALRVLGYEDIYTSSPGPAMVQRLCACGQGFAWPPIDC
ncbi:MAG: class I SAM-dependent methyltransferase [Burkholderiales bacterium]